MTNQYRLNSENILYFFLFRTDSDMKKVSIESDNQNKGRSSAGTRVTLEDDTDKQVEMRLLDSTPSQTKTKQTTKQVNRNIINISFHVL